MTKPSSPSPTDELVEIEAIDIQEWETDQRTPQTPDARLAALVKQSAAPPELPRKTTVARVVAQPTAPIARAAPPPPPKRTGAIAVAPERVATAPVAPPPREMPASSPSKSFVDLAGVSPLESAGGSHRPAAPRLVVGARGAVATPPSGTPGASPASALADRPLEPEALAAAGSPLPLPPNSAGSQPIAPLPVRPRAASQPPIVAQADVPVPIRAETTAPIRSSHRRIPWLVGPTIAAVAVVAVALFVGWLRGGTDAPTTVAAVEPAEPPSAEPAPEVASSPTPPPPVPSAPEPAEPAPAAPADLAPAPRAAPTSTSAADVAVAATPSVRAAPTATADPPIRPRRPVAAASEPRGSAAAGGIGLANARAAYTTGNQRLFGGDPAGALEAYREAIDGSPGFAAGYRGLGLAYAQLGDAANALQAFKTYLTLAPGAKDVPLIQKRIEGLRGKSAP